MSYAFRFNYYFNNIGVDDHVCTQFGKHCPPPHWLWHPEDVYNMDEIGWIYRVKQNKTPVQGKVCGRKIQKDHLNLAIS